MLLRIISAEGELFRGVVHKVTVPTEQGMLGILPGHMNIVSPLITGIISYLPQEEVGLLDSFADRKHSVPIIGGLFMVENDVITVTID